MKAGDVVDAVVNDAVFDESVVAAGHGQGAGADEEKKRDGDGEHVGYLSAETVLLKKLLCPCWVSKGLPFVGVLCLEENLFLGKNLQTPHCTPELCMNGEKSSTFADATSSLHLQGSESLKKCGDGSFWTFLCTICTCLDPHEAARTALPRPSKPPLLLRCSRWEAENPGQELSETHLQLSMATLPL